MSIDEDNPPLEPPSSGPLMDRFREVETEPPPEIMQFPPAARLPESLAPRASHATTEPAPDALVEALFLRLEPSLNNIYAKIEELFTLHEHAGLKLHAIDNGVGAAHARIGLLEDETRKLVSVTANLANGVFALAKDLNDHREATIQQRNHDGEEVRELRQSVTDLENRSSSAGE